MENETNKAHKKIFFQKCSFNNIYFILYILMTLVEPIIKYKTHPYFWEENTQEQKENIEYLLPYEILVFYNKNIADFFAIIPYLIMRKLSKEKKEIEDERDKLLIKENNENSEPNEAYELIYNDRVTENAEERKNLIIVYTIILSVLDFLGDFIIILFYLIFKDKGAYIYSFNSTVPLDIICQFVSSYFILKIHFYKLHYFCFVLYFVVFAIILIIDLINIFYLKSFEGYLYLFYPFSLIFYSIEYSLGKKVILYGYISLYLLILMRGFLKLILSIILSLFIFIFNKDIFIKIIFCLNTSVKILFFLADIITLFFESIFLWLIIDRFSPNHTPFVIIMKQLCDYIMEKVITPSGIAHNTEGWDLYVRLSLYLVLFIGVLLHNQIIVVNICGLGSDTKYFLDIKFEDERLYSITNSPDILKRYETLPDNEIKIEGEEEEEKDESGGGSSDENNAEDKNEEKKEENKIWNLDNEQTDSIMSEEKSTIIN